MTWSERIKLAWTTFKREALYLYGWSLISIGGIVVLMYAMFMGFFDQLRWAFPQANGSPFSPDMPVPGMPPTSGVVPFAGPFGSPNQDPFGSFGGPFSNFSTSFAIVGSIVGILFLIFIVTSLVGSLFLAGQFNMTAKAYREKVRFEDFRFSGFLRVLGWQVFLFLVSLLLVIIGVIEAIALRHSPFAIKTFFIIYALFITVVGIFTLPWLATSVYYLLAHREQKFRDALRSSWQFFRRHMGALWGYIGTIILIQIALMVLLKISTGLGYIASLAVSPFIAVLAIVWVLSLEDEEAPSTIVNPPVSDTQAIDTPAPEHPIPEVTTSTTPESEEPKITLQKEELRQSFFENTSPHCPSCGKNNIATAYCSQCGTKL